MWFRANEKELQALLGGISNIVKQALHDSLLSNANEDNPIITRLKAEVKKEIEKLNMPLPAPASALHEMVERYVNRNVSINTPAGIVEGMVTEVGSDYVEILETEDMVVIVQLANAISLQAG
ncbi:DUF2642 domain-containing protein [Paenibacillus alvei]|uniref:DUF2642 domain-containing protein n=1 Tax=Paenibacillus alvei TaxID=44250 RepID=UPI0018CECA3B|nr:DUF2642 domain-containing protein [Paenibacillus alvei]MBG9735624.1 hypothetical protein [Paenibacillus alvei]MBG9746646.1 hypothetical protein [Paenibacillus alvei]MCY9578415.1 DUF2642 domain-containing protein [Paenibacillus alvei]MCY9584736.1 DUF2642 domain-containing protein [Paenibacillus alvei]